MEISTGGGDHTKPCQGFQALHWHHHWFTWCAHTACTRAPIWFILCNNMRLVYTQRSKSNPCKPCTLQHPCKSVTTCPNIPSSHLLTLILTLEPLFFVIDSGRFCYLQQITVHFILVTFETSLSQSWGSNSISGIVWLLGSVKHMFWILLWVLGSGWNFHLCDLLSLKGK